MDKTGTFIGSLWVKRSNAGVLLLEAGLAKLHPSFSPDRTAEGPALQAAEKRAKDARLRVCCNHSRDSRLNISILGRRTLEFSFHAVYPKAGPWPPGSECAVAYSEHPA